MNDQPQQSPTGASSVPVTQRPGDAEANHLIQQVQGGDFSGVRQYLARSRQARDWQDRYFILNLIAPFVPVNALLALSATEPNAADLVFLLAVYHYDMIGQSRGTGVAEQTSAEQFDGAHQQLQKMMDHSEGLSAGRRRSHSPCLCRSWACRVQRIPKYLKAGIRGVGSACTGFRIGAFRHGQRPEQKVGRVSRGVSAHRSGRSEGEQARQRPGFLPILSALPRVAIREGL